ncbi:MAG: hypothetical protein JWN41_307 [Thermoleophilia bacterium]|nr:hypothetical protein [Thermoleophilia bacterium]
MSDESHKQRVDRELIELLNEIRIALPGVQVLFGFLLAVPFQQRFHHATSAQRDIYFVAICLAVVATALLIAPSVHHRINFRLPDKERLVLQSNVMVLCGVVALGASLTAVMLLIADVLFGITAAITVSALTAAVFLVFWFALPSWQRARTARS